LGGFRHSRQVKPSPPPFCLIIIANINRLVASEDEITPQVERLRNILGIEEIHKMAIETGFCKRKSKLSPEVFFDMMFYVASLTENFSLEASISYLESKYGIEMRKQSLDERFTEKTKTFVKTVLDRLISSQPSDILYVGDFLKNYNHVRIKDSTKFNVPDNLAEHYKGSGGSGDCKKAGISIQYEFDLKTGISLDLNITEAVRNDQKDAKETSENFCENDLVIRDLGYFSTSVLSKIAEKKAYFLSRLNANVSVYDENGKEFDFEKLYGFMTKNGIEKCEKFVTVSNNKLPVRLFIGLVPYEVYNERIRRKQTEEKKKGRTMAERTKLLYHFNLFITNAEEEKLPFDKIMPLYWFRWQIELMFKNWKSVFSIQKFQKMKETRYITMLYIRLIFIVLNMQIVNSVQSAISKQKLKKNILSYQKTLQTLKTKFVEILIILRSSQEDAVNSLKDIYNILSENHWRENRKNRENFIENIFRFSC